MKGRGRAVTRRVILVLAGVLLVQTVVVARVFTPRPHSGGDNAGYVALAHSLLDRGAYLELWDPEEPPHTKYPPLLATVLAGAVLLGARSWAALKVIPAFSTILAVAFAFLWARERRGLGLGVGVALLLGLSESVVYYSQWVLSDPVFLALSVAALWALERSRNRGGETGEDPGGAGWLAGGMVLVLAAYFTRSAGLPLVVAALGWLALQRRWRALGTFGVVLGGPALLWWLRGRMAGGGEYVSEFWLVDPYRPGLGTVGLPELLDRLVQNLVAYVTEIIPAGVVGDLGPVLPLLGLALVLLAGVGWIRCFRKRWGVAELFLPLYFGLILLWPQPWSGDRFSLPLLPLLFFYGGVALLWLLGTLPERIRAVALGLAVALVALPAAAEWNRIASPAGACREATDSGRWEACLPEAEGDYLTLARWTGSNLPEGAVVTTRKPRRFFLESGVKAQSIPLTTDPGVFLERMAGKGSRYVSLDRLDGLSGYYVVPAVTGRVGRFCAALEVGRSPETASRLLGVLGVDPGEGPGDVGQALTRCPPEVFPRPPREPRDREGWTIRLLDRVPSPGS